MQIIAVQIQDDYIQDFMNYVNSHKENITIGKELHLKEDIFTSKQNEYIFYLTELEGEILLNKLNVQNKHYEDKTSAKKWYKEISKYVHPDKNQNNNKSNDAFNALNKIYNILIDND